MITFAACGSEPENKKDDEPVHLPFIPVGDVEDKEESGESKEELNGVDTEEPADPPAQAPGDGIIHLPFIPV